MAIIVDLASYRKEKMALYEKAKRLLSLLQTARSVEIPPSDDCEAEETTKKKLKLVYSRHTINSETDK